MLFGAGLWYSKSKPMVNLAEMQALLDLLERAEYKGMVYHCEVLQVFGNLKLICDFANRAAQRGCWSCFWGFGRCAPA